MLKTLILALALTSAPVFADVIFLDATERGWVSNGLPNSNGSSPTNNYIAGELASSEFRDWFEFSIPDFSGSLVSATLMLAEPLPGGHMGGSLVYSVFGLTSQPMSFTDVTGSNLFGSAITNSTESEVDINLNSPALAAIASSQSHNLFIGGIDSGELGTETWDFGSSGNFRTILKLNSVPEPNTLGLVLLGLVFSVALIFTKRIRERRATARSN